MESNRIADDVRMKLMGKIKCPHCMKEILPSTFSLKGSGMHQLFCPVCRLSILSIKDTRPENKDTIHSHEEPK